MKLNCEMEFVSIDCEKLAVPVGDAGGFRGVLQMNGAAEFILQLLARDTDEDEMMSALRERYDASDEELRWSVEKTVGILRAEGLLDE